jgi:hypothetical protein
VPSALALALFLALATAAQGSVQVGTAASGAKLHVDAAGDVLVTWTQAGAKESVFITAQGVLTRGDTLPGPDVSAPSSIPIPDALVTRRTERGNLWALQLITRAGSPAALDLSHWRGAGTTLTMAVNGSHLTGSVTFDGKPVTGHTQTPGGRTPRIYVYLDCFGCGGQAGWTPMLGVAPTAAGTFSVFVRPAWIGTKYRATIAGPNIGTTYAPDAQIVVA